MVGLFILSMLRLVCLMVTFHEWIVDRYNVFKNFDPDIMTLCLIMSLVVDLMFSFLFLKTLVAVLVMCFRNRLMDVGCVWVRSSTVKYSFLMLRRYPSMVNGFLGTVLYIPF